MPSISWWVAWWQLDILYVEGNFLTRRALKKNASFLTIRCTWRCSVRTWAIQWLLTWQCKPWMSCSRAPTTNSWMETLKTWTCYIIWQPVSNLLRQKCAITVLMSCVRRVVEQAFCSRQVSQTGGVILLLSQPSKELIQLWLNRPQGLFSSRPIEPLKGSSLISYLAIWQRQKS